MTVVQEPHRHFRGVHARPELFKLVEEGKITGELAWLLLVIESYIGFKGEGCWATDETLARDTGRKPRQIRNMLRQLRGFRKKEGKWIANQGPKLIRTIAWKKMKDGGNRRVLETKYARIDDSEDWKVALDAPPPGNLLPGDSRKEITAPLPVINYRDKDTDKNKKDEKGEKRPATPAYSPRRDSISAGKKSEPTKQSLDWADRLRQIFRSRNSYTTSWGRKAGAEVFQRMLARLGNDPAKIETFLDRFDRFGGKVVRPSISSVHDLDKPAIFTWLSDQLAQLDENSGGPVSDRTVSYNEKGEKIITTKFRNV